MAPQTPPETAKLLKEKRDIEEFGLEARKEVQEQTFVGQKVLMFWALIVAWKVKFKKKKKNHFFSKNSMKLCCWVCRLSCFTLTK